jgi:rhomboid protease GluP
VAAAFGKRNQVQWEPAVTPGRPLAPATATTAAATPHATDADRMVFRTPIVTIGLLVLLSAIYALETRFAPGGFVSGRTVAGYGALEGDLVFAGEWWRLFTAPLLHGSWSHLIGNAAVFGVVGFALEPLIGPRWFAGLFAIGALGGALMSLFVSPADIPGVGASGAIMCVLGATFLCGASAKSGPSGRKMQSRALFFILPALIPFSGDTHTDFAAHLGGLLAGLATGVFLLLSWTRGELRPAFGTGGSTIGGAFLVIGLASFLLFAGKPSNAAVVADAASGLIPEAELPHGLSVTSDRARELLDRYPGDPRAHLFRGIAFLQDDHDLADAETQFRAALDPDAIAHAHLEDSFRDTVTVLLALTLSYEGKPDLAQKYGAPLCTFARDMGDLYDSLHDRAICP